MIDLHTHILHGFDDGAESFEESLAMARTAAADGVRIIAATPHSPGSVASRVYAPALIRERVDELNAALRAADLPIEVIVGTEIAYGGDAAAQLQSDALLSYSNSQTVLFEPPYGRLPPTFDTAIFSLQVAGYRVLLAHPERIPDVQHDPNRLLPLVQRGVLVQITAGALTGAFGERQRRTSELLLTHHMAHVIASDAHGTAPRRQPLLSAARQRAAELLGTESAQALVDAHAQALLNGQPIHMPAPRAVAQRGSFWRW